MRILACLGLVAVGCGGPAAPAPAVVANDQPAEIVDEQPPLAVIVIVDRSGSMQGAKLDASRAGAHAVAEGLPADALFGLIAFDSQATTLVRLQGARHRDAIATGIDTLTAGGGTNYLPALQSAAEQLEAVSAARKVVVFLSDGEAPYDGVVAIVDDLRAHGATLSTIGLAGADVNLLGLMAEAGGGAMFSLDDPTQLAAVMQRALE